MSVNFRPTRAPHKEKRGEIPAFLIIAPASTAETHPDHTLGALFDCWRNLTLSHAHLLGKRETASADELAKRDEAGGADTIDRRGRKADAKLERFAAMEARTVAGVALKLAAAWHRAGAPDAEGLIPKVIDAARHDALRLAGAETMIVRDGQP